MKILAAPLSACAALALAACGDNTDRASLTEDPAAVDQAYDGLPGDPALTDLRDVDNPVTTLASADVRDRVGQPVGVVDRVEVAADGSVDGLIIELNGGDRVRVTPLQARYDEGVHTVELTVTLDQLERAVG